MNQAPHDSENILNQMLELIAKKTEMPFAR
jgi:hypothetical protein